MSLGAAAIDFDVDGDTDVITACGRVGLGETLANQDTVQPDLVLRREAEGFVEVAGAVGFGEDDDGRVVVPGFFTPDGTPDIVLAEQLSVVAASVMAGVGIAGIPEAGLVILPLVLTAAGLPEAAVASAVPLIVPVDWIVARVRSGVNVMDDMVVAVVLDRFEPPDAPEPAAPAP
jgi:hypothetical protein